MIHNKNNTINLYLNSKQALKQLQGTSNCIFDFSALPIDDGEIFVSIQSAQIPGTFYNVDDINNLFNYSVGVTNYQILIPQANYNVNSLLIYLQSIMTAQGFTIAFNTATNKYTFTNTTSFIFKSSSTCFELLGFTEGQQFSSVANTLTSNLVVNFFTIRNVLIEISNLMTYNKTSNPAENNSSILVSIPITTSQNSVLSYSNIYGLYEKISSVSNFAALQVRLLDQDLDLLDLNGGNWSATIQLNY
jgi:hypothetical protein